MQKIDTGIVVDVVVSEDFTQADWEPVVYRANAYCDDLGGSSRINRIVGLGDEGFTRWDTMCLYAYGDTPAEAIDQIREDLQAMGISGTLRVYS